jgi:hypothetical protein
VFTALAPVCPLRENSFTQLSPTLRKPLFFSLGTALPESAASRDCVQKCLVNSVRASCAKENTSFASEMGSLRVVYDFFFTVTCACNHSKRFKRCLSLSGTTFALPAVLFSYQGSRLMAALTASLTATTIAYHATHNPRIRALDIVALWATILVGTAQALHSVAMNGPNAYLGLGLLCIVPINAINVSSFAHDEPGLISLPWHLMLHMLCTVSLSLLAIGAAKPDLSPTTIFGTAALLLCGPTVLVVSRSARQSKQAKGKPIGKRR